LECFQLRPGDLESMSTHEFAELMSSIALVLQKLPEIPLENLRSLANKLEQVDRGPEEKPKPYEMYKGVPIHLYQTDRLDEWGASVEWCGRLAHVQLREWEKPTEETVVDAAHRLINLLEDMKNNGVIWPESYFRPK
jgi:hypothetical protein